MATSRQLYVDGRRMTGPLTNWNYIWRNTSAFRSNYDDSFLGTYTPPAVPLKTRYNRMRFPQGSFASADYGTTTEIATRPFHLNTWHAYEYPQDARPKTSQLPAISGKAVRGSEGESKPARCGDSVSSSHTTLPCMGSANGQRNSNVRVPTQDQTYRYQAAHDNGRVLSANSQQAQQVQQVQQVQQRGVRVERPSTAPTSSWFSEPAANVAVAPIASGSVLSKYHIRY